MSSAQHIERGNGRPWHKRVLIPFWVLQIIFMGLQVAAAAAGLYVNRNRSIPDAVYTTVNGNNTTVNGSNNTVTVNNMTYTGPNTIVTGSSGNNVVMTYSSTTYSNTVAIVAYAILLSLALLGLLSSAAEIVLFARHRLSPTKYFVSNLLKFLAWTVLFALAVLAAASYGVSVLSLVVNVAVELVLLGALIYASVIFHRFRRDRRDGAAAVRQGLMVKGPGGGYA
ncbi:hypothetical protein MMC11_000387 [Xylographa trunciseda]|nr:hypothetical protein [Xylographa trunciseda]